MTKPLLYLCICVIVLIAYCAYWHAMNKRYLKVISCEKHCAKLVDTIVSQGKPVISAFCYAFWDLPIGKEHYRRIHPFYTDLYATWTDVLSAANFLQKEREDYASTGFYSWFDVREAEAAQNRMERGMYKLRTDIAIMIALYQKLPGFYKKYHTLPWPELERMRNALRELGKPYESVA